jgi:fructose-1,6-bisphosphatase/inositol monophosphatase family enzyme
MILYDESRCISACTHISRAIVAPAIRSYLSGPTQGLEAKHDKSLVTAADRTIEHSIRDYLAKKMPGFGVIGEELGAKDSEAEYVWTVDPIDGTEAFVSGAAQFGTLLAVIHQQGGRREPVLGALYLPIQDLLVIGNRSVTTLNGRPVRMPAAAEPAQKCLLLGDLAEMVRRVPARQQAKVMELAACYRTAQTWGDCLGYVNMLKGYAHAQLNVGLGVEDIAPLEPIVFGAGGHVTAWDGRSLVEALSELPSLEDSSSEFSSIAAVSPQAHTEILTHLL